MAKPARTAMFTVARLEVDAGTTAYIRVPQASSTSKFIRYNCWFIWIRIDRIQEILFGQSFRDFCTLLPAVLLSKILSSISSKFTNIVRHFWLHKLSFCCLVRTPDLHWRQALRPFPSDFFGLFNCDEGMLILELKVHTNSLVTYRTQTREVSSAENTATASCLTSVSMLTCIY